ncbi:MAG: cell division protein ZapA [Elusimicrobiota bacterium]|jgi:hypothetical protein|nr:cell division protein ZapA [Elusimicrobiota bacterium]
MQKYSAKVMGKDISVSAGELGQLDIQAIVNSLNHQWEIVKINNVDTQKAAALISFELAKELFQLKNKQTEVLETDRKKMKKLISRIDETIG